MDDENKIAEYLAAIRNAIYGRDVRQAIYDSISECYSDVRASQTIADESLEAVEQAIETANTAAESVESLVTSGTELLSTLETKSDDMDAVLNAADTITESVEAIDGMTVSSEDGSTSSPASATISNVNGHKNIHFVLRPGQQGASYTIKGSAYATLAALQNGVSNPQVGDQYNVGSSPPYNVYRWTGSSWEDQGTIAPQPVEMLSANEVDNINNGTTVSGDNKVLGVTGLAHLLRDILVTALSGKVDKVTGKGLSANDFTDIFKTKLNGIEVEANKTVVDSELSASSTNPVQNSAISAELSNKLDKNSVDSGLSSTSTNPVQNKAVNAALNTAFAAIDGKVDKVTGKGLSTNDFTTELKNKLDGIATGATAVAVDSAITENSTNAVQSGAIYSALDGKVDKESGKGLSENDFTTTLKDKLDGIAAGANKTTVDNSLSSTSKNPVQNKVINTALGNKVDKVTGKGLSTNDFTNEYKDLVDGLASGSGQVVIDSSLDTTSTNPVQNKVIAEAINGKVDKVTNKGLSKNDFTDAYKTKLEGIAVGATAVVIDSAITENSTNAAQSGAVYTALSNKVDKVNGKGLSTNDFTNAYKTKLEGIDTGATAVIVDSTLTANSTNAAQSGAVYAAINSHTNLIITSQTVAIVDWEADTSNSGNATYTDYPYRAEITATGAEPGLFAFVVFDPAQYTDGIYAPVCNTGSGVVYVYASEVPAASITIPTIIIFR